MLRFSKNLTTAALLFFTVTAVWAQAGLLRGTVVDSDGNPIPGVKITVTSEQLASFRKTLTSDSRGAFKIRVTKNQIQYVFDFQFEKPGYQSFKQPLSLSTLEATRQEFPMEKLESQVVETHGDLSAVVTGSTNVAVEAFNAGLTAQRAGDLASARTKLEEALVADPSLVPAHIAMSQILLDLGEYAAALESADRALELGGSPSEPLRVKYQALRASGREAEAEAISVELEQAEDAVASARRFYNEGGEAFQAEDHATALARFQKATELDPSLTDAHHAVATLLYAKGDYEGSAKSAETALAQGSEDVRTLRVLFNAYEALGRTEELMEIAPRLAAVDPEFGGAKLVEQAAALWNSGQTKKAASLSRLALATDPNLAKAYYFIGLDHLSRGENTEAGSALEKFIAMAPDDADAPAARDMLTYID